MVSHFENIPSESHPFAGFTCQFHRSHKLHLNPYDAFTLTLLTSAPLYIEREVGGLKIILDGSLLF